MSKNLLTLTFTLALFGLSLLGCNSEFRSMVKKSKSKQITDLDTAAVWFYQHKKYDRALPLLEQLVPATAGTDRQPELYYYYAWSRYMMGEMVSSAFYFEDFANKFPANEHAEECEFMVVKCYYRLSDPHYLDQTYTNKAMAQAQLFLSRNPKSEYEEKAENILTDLRERKAKKAFRQAMLYYDLTYYKAAKLAFETMIKEFPDSEFREEAQFMLYKSAHDLAGASTTQKQIERYEESQVYYNKFLRKYPESDFARDAKSMHASGERSLDRLREDRLEQEQISLYRRIESNVDVARRTDLAEERSEAMEAAMEAYEELRDDYPASPWLSKADGLLAKMDAAVNELD